MAGTVITLQSFAALSSPNTHRFAAHLAPCSPFSSLHSSAFWKKGKRRLTQHKPIASSSGAPNDLLEDAKFVPLNADDPVYGPPAILLMGFEANETDKIREFLKELDGEFLKVIHCTEDMLTRSVWDVINTEQPNLEAVEIAVSLPRLCLLSGLSGEEMMMFIDAFPETGLEPAVFAAVVPNSADKLLGDVMEEIMGDHEMMQSTESPS